MPDAKQRKAQTLRAIELASNLAGIDPRPTQALALHESGGDYLAEHRLPADVAANERAYQREAKRYAGNPFYGDAWRWSVGRGPLGQVIADNLHFIGTKRDPLALHDPAWSALAAVRRIVALADHRAKQGKQTTWENVHRSWKWGNSEGGKDAAATAKSDAAWREYLASHGAPGMADELVTPWPQAGWSTAPSSADDRTVRQWHADLGELDLRKAAESDGDGSGVLVVVGLSAAALAVLGGAAALLLRGRR